MKGINTLGQALNLGSFASFSAPGARFGTLRCRHSLGNGSMGTAPLLSLRWAIKDLQDYSGFCDIEDEAFLLITIIPITPTRECRGVWIHGAPSQTPFDVLALVLTLCLGYTGMKSKEQLPCLAEEVDPLIIEKDINFQFLEPPERHQKINAVASEPADGLGIDHIDLTRLTISKEALEARTGTYGPTRLDVGIGTDILPSGIIQDVLFLEIHLG